LRWVVAYNFKHCLVNFLQAQTIDPDCAMCAWGEALCRGQNLNDFMDLSKDNVHRMYAAAQRAVGLNEKFVALSPEDRERKKQERALLKASVLRYAPEPEGMADGEARGRLNEQYADAMAEVATQFPHNVWILYFAADAQMNTSPWNYWNEMLPAGQGKTLREPRIVKADQYLKTILKLKPKHAGGLHLTIHIYEGAADAFPAVAAAKKLDGLVRGSEHLLHMPSHGYIRAGMYKDAARVNEEAQEVPLEEHAYPEHNIEFIVYANNYLAEEIKAQEAALHLNRVAEDFLATGRDGYEAIFPYERFVVAPLYTGVLFGNWTYLEPFLASAPPAKRIYHRAYYHFARGFRALKRDGTPAEAERELELIGQSKAEMQEEQNLKRYTGALYPVVDIIKILGLYLEAAIQKARGESAYLDLLEEAAKVEFYYDEPPSLFFPAQMVYGLEAKAEKVLREALVHCPGNKWGLDALSGKEQESFI
jgi:hypothetical protein